MPDKITLSTLTGSFADVNVLNENFTSIADLINTELLSRNNRVAGAANQLESNVDINSQLLYNIPNGTEASHAINYAQLVASQNTTAFTGTIVEGATSTASQTAFNLQTITYTPGANNLSVYIQGVRQRVGTDYTETDSTTVTFLEGLDDGDLVLFIANERPVSVGTTPASSVTLNVQGTSYNVSSYLNAIDTLTGSKDHDWGSIASQGTATTTIAVTGALTTHTVDAYMDIDLLGVQLTSYVSSADTVTVRATNPTGSAVDLTSGSLRVRVHKV